MPEMLVRLFDKYEGQDKTFIAKTTMRGDVISVVEDGHKWSEIERTSFNWVILKVSASLVKCMSMRTPELGDAKLNPYLRIMAFHFDLDALTVLGYAIPTAAEAKQGRDKDQKRPIATIEILETQMDAVKVEKPKIADPAIIGDVK